MDSEAHATDTAPPAGLMWDWPGTSNENTVYPHNIHML